MAKSPISKKQDELLKKLVNDRKRGDNTPNKKTTKFAPKDLKESLYTIKDKVSTKNVDYDKSVKKEKLTELDIKIQNNKKLNRKRDVTVSSDDSSPEQRESYEKIATTPLGILDRAAVYINSPSKLIGDLEKINSKQGGKQVFNTSDEDRDDIMYNRYTLDRSPNDKLKHTKDRAYNAFKSGINNIALAETAGIFSPARYAGTGLIKGLSAAGGVGNVAGDILSVGENAYSAIDKNKELNPGEAAYSLADLALRAGNMNISDVSSRINGWRNLTNPEKIDVVRDIAGQGSVLKEQVYDRGSHYFRNNSNRANNESNFIKENQINTGPIYDATNNFKNGGKVDTDPPKKILYVKDKNDPRYKAYQDSLTLYKNNFELIENARKHGYDILSEDRNHEKSGAYRGKTNPVRHLSNKLKQDFKRGNVKPAYGMRKEEGDFYSVLDLFPGIVNPSLKRQLIHERIEPTGHIAFKKPLSSIFKEGFGHHAGDVRSAHFYDTKPQREVRIQKEEPVRLKEDKKPIVTKSKVVEKSKKDYWDTDPAVLDFRKKFVEQFGEEPSRNPKEAMYDYDKAYRAGVRPVLDEEDGLYHWDSGFKHDDHPNRFVGGVDTRSGRQQVLPIENYLSPIRKENDNIKIYPQAKTNGWFDVVENIHGSANYHRGNETKYKWNPANGPLPEIAPNNKRTVTSSYANGGPIETDPLKDEFTSAKEWTKNYLLSPKYRERLESSGYENIDKEINDRISGVDRTTYKQRENRDGTYFNPSNKRIVHSPEQDIKNAAPFTPSTEGAVLAHELSHAETSKVNGSRMNKYDRDQLKQRLSAESRIPMRYIDDKGQERIRRAEHDGSPSENKSDLNGLRYDLYKSGLYDSGTEEFTEDHLRKADEAGILGRLKRNYSDKDLIWLMNNIAQINMNKNIDRYG
jgi:hypothetical protein